MDFLNDMGITENMFETKEAMDTLDDIVKEIKRFDVFDVIARFAGLNLMSQNQNKSIVIDAIIAKVLCSKESEYPSTYKMSAGRFKKLLQQLNTTQLCMAIDPNENSFIQNVMMDGNYRVFNGIDHSPAYNLQMLVYVLFEYKNDFPIEFLKKIRRLFLLILDISEEVAGKINITIENSVSDEQKEVVIPDGDRVSEYASYVTVSEERFQYYFSNVTEMEEYLSNFDTSDEGELNNRPFYSKPFLKNSKDNTIILLNISLLPTFAFFTAICIADTYGIKDNLMNSFNSFVWNNCRKSLDLLNHHKILESSLKIELKNTSYYKEMIANVYNNQLMLVCFLCDDADGYSAETMHDSYPDERHTKIFEERMTYFNHKIEIGILKKEDLYCMSIVNGFGRGLGVKAAIKPSIYRVLKLNPFELHCIRVMENKMTDFIPKYIRAKNKVKSMVPDVFSELNAISIYTSNHYSFYMADDINTYNMHVWFAPGDSIEYIGDALKKEERILIDSYIDGYKTEVVASDKIRRIFVEDKMFENNRSALCVFFSNCRIWFTSDEIKEEIELNLYFSILDTITFWLSECRVIIENMELPFRTYHFNVVLGGEKREYYYENNEEKPLKDLLEVEIINNHISLVWSPLAFAQMNQINNNKERELCDFIIQILQQFLDVKKEFQDDLNIIFSNSLKKKMFSIDYQNTPYLKPIEFGSDRFIRMEDEEYLADIVGKDLLKSGKWSYGIVPDKDRNAITQTVVEILYKMLQHEVAQLSSLNLVEAIYMDLETTLYKLMLAGKRYAYDLACYPEKEDELVGDYNNLNRASLALKFMMEYVAAQPPKGNDLLGIGKYEYILAICSLIILWAYKGDLFYYNIFNTPIEILQSDRVGMKQNEFMNMYQYGDKFRREQLYYMSSSNFRKKYTVNREDDSEELNAAYFAEYGYTFYEFVKVTLCLVQFGSEKFDDDIFVEKKENIINWIVKMNSELSYDLVSNILADISLVERDDFLKPPSKYKPIDVYPWRFNRKYSFNRRPIVVRNEDLVWGNRQLYHMLEYVTDLIYDGKFPTKNNTMSSFLGKISNERGNKFNQLIVDILQDMRVFNVDSNVKKINNLQIADNKGNALGDIDVLIIDKEKNHIYIAEVKDFNFSRNPYEIQMEYQKMFVDTNKEKCYATKHKRRVDWVIAHIDDLKRQYSLADVVWEISGVFIVSEPLISNNVYGQKIEIISKAELSIERIRKIS